MAGYEWAQLQHNDTKDVAEFQPLLLPACSVSFYWCEIFSYPAIRFMVINMLSVSVLEFRQGCNRLQKNSCILTIIKTIHL